jgi:hypothetical protein
MDDVKTQERWKNGMLEEWKKLIAHSSKIINNRWTTAFGSADVNDKMEE